MKDISKSTEHVLPQNLVKNLLRKLKVLRKHRHWFLVPSQKKPFQLCLIYSDISSCFLTFRNLASCI